MRSPKPPLWSRFLAVTLPFFGSQVRGRAFVALGLLFALLLAVNGLNVVNSYAGRDFMTALEEGRAREFYTKAAILVGVFAASTLAEVFARYAEQWLGLLWRDWLTRRLLDRYFANHTYSRLASRSDIDNPDQRISEDARNFTEMTLSFFVLILNAALTVVAFVTVLWSITPWLFLAVVAYAAAGSLGTVLLGRQLVELNNRQQRKEADFRFGLGRVREHAAELAQRGGGAEEKARLGRLLGVLVANYRRIIRVSRNLSFFTTGYNFLPQLIPAAIVAPLYFHGQVKFGTVTQAAMAFSQALGAFSLIVSQFQQISTYAAVVKRLASLWEATQPEGAPAPAHASTPPPRKPEHSPEQEPAQGRPPCLEDQAVSAKTADTPVE